MNIMIMVILNMKQFKYKYYGKETNAISKNY